MTDTPPTITQADVDRAAEAARAAAKADAEAALRAQLPDGADLAQVLADAQAKRDADAKNRTDLEQAQAAQAAAEKAKADAEAAAAAKDGTIAEHLKRQLIEHALVRKGMSLDEAAAASDLVKVGDLAPDTAVATVTAAVEQTATTFPQLFTGTAGTPPPAPAPAVPGGAQPPAPAIGGKTMEQVGRELAAKHGLPARPATAA